MTMTDVQTPHERTLSYYVDVLKRRKWIIIEVPIIAVIVVAGLSVRQEKVFRSDAQMLISRQDLGAAVTGLPSTDIYADPARTIQTQARLARVPEVARRAIAQAGLRGRITAAELLASSTVTASGDSDFLNFTVDDPDPTIAARLATAYANAYSGYRLELDTSTLKEARTELQRQITALKKSGGDGSSLYNSLVGKAQQLETMELLQQRNSVVRNASAGTQIAPTPRRNVMLGALFGLLFGVAIAAVWEALDRRVRSEDEVADRLDLPVLARLPAPPRHLSNDGRLAMIDEPTEIASEAARRLRTNIEFANLDAPVKTIMVTSSVQREGKSTTIANLAAALARAGRNVVLVDLDLRQPMVAQFFGRSGSIGVTDVALGRVSLRDALIRVTLAERSGGLVNSSAGNGHPLEVRDYTNVLSVLPAGSAPASPGEFVGTTALGQLLDSLKGEFDFVLIDAPPMCVVGDAMTLSAHVDAIIVVARLGVANRQNLKDLHRELTASPARKLGIVLTGVDPKESYGYGGYGSSPPESPRARPPRARTNPESEQRPASSRR